MSVVDFATFCYSGDAHRLHAPGQLQKQVESNGYPFNRIIEWIEEYKDYWLYYNYFPYFMTTAGHC